jgi:hypothetical protein
MTLTTYIIYTGFQSWLGYKSSFAMYWDTYTVIGLPVFRNIY